MKCQRVDGGRGGGDGGKTIKWKVVITCIIRNKQPGGMTTYVNLTDLLDKYSNLHIYLYKETTSSKEFLGPSV